MDCTLIQVELVPYHLGALSGSDYDAIEAHLVECKECLVAYMAVKRHLEVAPARPSEATRKRLREDVEREFGGASVRSFFARPIPLYQGLAVAAAVALLVGIAPGIAHRAAARTQAPVAVAPPPDVTPVNPRVDTSRHDAENLAFY